MKKQFAEYRWLAGGHGVRGSLWEGPDHLLVIEGRGFLFAYREIYRRLDYKNIQAISMANTSGHVWGIVLLSLAAGLLSLVWLSVFENYGLSAGAGALTVAPLATLALLFVHLYRGGSCKCAIQTAVLFLHLKPLKRRKTALQVLERIHAAVLRHQGETEAGVGLGATPGMAHSMPPAAYAPQPFPGFPPTPMAKPIWRGSRLARICMALLMLWGLMLAGKGFLASGMYFIGQTVLATIAAMLCVIVLVQVSGYLMPKQRIRPILWLSLVNILVAGIACVILFIVTMVQQSITPPHERDALLKIAGILGNITFLNGGYGTLVFVLPGLAAALMGALGLPATMPDVAAAMPEVAAPEPPPSPPSTGPWS